MLAKVKNRNTKLKYDSNKENVNRYEVLQNTQAKKAVSKTEVAIKEEVIENQENFKNNCIAYDADTNRCYEDNHESSKLKLSDLQYAKKNSDNKQRELEDRMKQSELIAERMILERDKLNVELDRLILELKQTKMELALSEERKEDVELALKNEIKYLVNKIMAAKGINSPLSPREIFQFVNGGLNRSIGDHTSFMNSSGFLNQSGLGTNCKAIRQVYSPIERSNSVIHNSLDKRSAFSCSSPRLEKPENKSISKKNISQMRSSPSESPQKLNELENNQGPVLKNIVNTSLLQPKKLVQNFFSK